ncbi:unnamed protein product [Larinioides sclopetarius]|uniref:Tumor protein p53-inducible protein 11 n=1 Tax=Larinioides sclopetarius TaxID=280406 RepID=A0AAV2A9K8_9ARAC
MADNQQLDAPLQTKDEAKEKPIIKPLSAIAHRMFHPPKLERKHSSGDLHSRLKTRKILGVGETDNGDIHRSKDGAPPHFSLSRRKALNGKYPDSRIGRDGPIPWPARSPDLTPLDFFFWGYIKNIVYSERIADISHLKRRIIAAIETVTPDTIFKTWKEIDYRLDNLFFPENSYDLPRGDDSVPREDLACRFYGCTSLALAFLMWSFWGTMDKAVVRTLLLASALCHSLQVLALVTSQWGSLLNWRTLTYLLVRSILVLPNAYFYRNIGFCGLRMRKSNSFNNLRDCVYNSNSSSNSHGK